VSKDQFEDFSLNSQLNFKDKKETFPHRTKK
jgi:hypothetical protein